MNATTARANTAGLRNGRPDMIRRRGFRIVAAAAFGLLASAALGVGPATAGDDAEAAAKELTAGLTARAFELTRMADAAAAQKVAALRPELEQAFAFDVWEKFMLAGREAMFSEGQLTEFRTLLPQYLSSLYAKTFANDFKKPPVVGDARAVRRDVIVSTKFPRETAGDLPVDFRVRRFEDRGPRIIDIMVGGASYLVLKRDEFTSLLDRDGPDALLSFMRGFVAS